MSQICQTEFYLPPTYNQLWKTKTMFEEKFSNHFTDIQKLPSFGKILNKKYPRSNFQTELTSNNQLNRLFFILEFSVEEFIKSNKVLFLDGTFLNTKYKGILLIASFYIQTINFAYKLYQLFPLKIMKIGNGLSEIYYLQFQKSTLQILVLFQIAKRAC